MVFIFYIIYGIFILRKAYNIPDEGKRACGLSNFMKPKIKQFQWKRF